ncbi:MAG: hypothetical protein COB14_07470 [Alphaproteobacteria bacterium]|nr:MAG: hypothetical protein COB14_07470 [Alphaproteobacteria bacterium]
MAKKKTVARSVYLEEDVDKALKNFMASKNINNISLAVNDALKQVLFQKERDERSLQNQILYSLNQHRNKTARDLAANQEILLQFMFEYFANNPASDKRDPEAQKRLDALMETVVRNLGQSKIMQELNEDE